MSQTRVPQDSMPGRQDLGYDPISQIMFGSDYPFFPISMTADGLSKVGLADADLQAIERDNALALFTRLRALPGTRVLRAPRVRAAGDHTELSAKPCTARLPQAARAHRLPPRVERDGVIIHLQAASETTRQPGHGAVNVFVTDVDALYRELKARGARTLNEPKDYPYGMRDFDVHDLDGNHLCFGMESKQTGGSR